MGHWLMLTITTNPLKLFVGMGMVAVVAVAVGYYMGLTRDKRYY